MTMRSARAKRGRAKSISRSDSGVENSRICPSWIEAVEALLAQLEEAVAKGVGAIRGETDGGTGCTSGSRRARAHALGHLIDGVALHELAAARAVRAAGAGEEQTQEVVEFGGGGDGRARIAGGVLLADGDGRGEAVDVVDVGLLHALEELAGIGGEGFDRSGAGPRRRWCRRRGGLAGSRDTGDDGELVVRGSRARPFLRLWSPRSRMTMESSTEGGFRGAISGYYEGTGKARGALSSSRATGRMDSFGAGVERRMDPGSFGTGRWCGGWI